MKQNIPVNGKFDVSDVEKFNYDNNNNKDESLYDDFEG